MQEIFLKQTNTVYIGYKIKLINVQNIGRAFKMSSFSIFSVFCRKEFCNMNNILFWHGTQLCGIDKTPIIEGQVRLRQFLGRALRLGWARGPSAEASTGQGAERRGYDKLGGRRCGHIINLGVLSIPPPPQSYAPCLNCYHVFTVLFIFLLSCEQKTLTAQENTRRSFKLKFKATLYIFLYIIV